MTASSVLVPVAGVLTQPILAHALGVEGRGELAAALAPAALALAAATLGLPDALTFYLAKHPAVTRRALAVATMVTLTLGLVCLGTVDVAGPFLSGGDGDLARLILLAMAITVPALLVGVLRGAASGRQLWTEVAVERVASTILRVVSLGTLAILGALTVFSAVVATTVVPVVAGFIYWRLLLKPPSLLEEPPFDGAVSRKVVSYGSRVWLGSIASMVLSRLDQLLMTPLSSVEQLGYYSVAVTIADVPLIVVLAIAGAVTGVNSRSNDPQQITDSARLTVILGLLGCGALAAVAPLMIPILFGAEFGPSTLPTVMLIASAFLCIPGLMASAGLSSHGRPGLRSVGLLVTLVVNVGCFVILVPVFGAPGAATTSLLSNVVLTTYMVVAASRVMGVPVRDFVVLRRSDFVRVWGEVRSLPTRLGARRRARSSAGSGLDL